LGSGGTSPYTYSWSNSATGATASNLAAGTYTVTVTDAGGCTATQTCTITQPASALAATATAAAPTCAGGTGSATVSASGGTSPYTYLWSNGATTSTATGLANGNYTVIVTDFKGCTITKSVTVNQPTILNATIASTAITCNGANNGSLIVTPSGGTSPYTYAWSNSVTTATNSSLAPATYTVTVTDAAGCTKVTSATLTQPAAITLGVSSTTASCGASNGTATATPSVAGAFTYLWSNGQTTQTATGLAAGNYSITATSAAGCSATASVIVASTGSVGVTVTTTNVTCFGTSTGTATANGTGGTSPYTYAWSNSATGATASNLIAGSYSVTVTDASGCTSTQTFSITQPTVLAATATAAAPGCSGGTGSASVVASGGTAPYSYLWTNGSTATVASGLNNGSHSVTVTDANGCTITKSVTITQPTALSGSITSSAVSCFGLTNGSASASVSGGTSPYSYAWSSGSTTSTANSLAAGNYTLVVTDANSCTLTLSTTITQPIALTASASATPATCLPTGSATVTASGGTSPYTYLWSNGATTATASGLSSGSYTVTITDAQACTATASVTVSQPSALSVSINTVAITCNGSANGSLTAVPTGGTSPYTYAWSNAVTTATSSNLAPGTFSVTVTDAAGCTATNSSTLTQPAGMSLSTSITPATCGGNDGTASVSVSSGNSPYTYSWNSSPVQTTSTATGLSSGSYTVTVTDASGCSSSASAVIANTGGLTLSVNITSQVSCFGGNDGAAVAIANGGSAPYSYVWSNGTTGSTLTGVIAGTYTCNVTAANGCTAGQSITITEPSAINGVMSSTSINCYNANTGSATVLASGGAGLYTYVWSNGALGATASNLGAGTYSVVITDQNNCSVTRSITLTGPAQLSVTETITHVNCAGQNGGAISLAISGGNSPYTTTWSTGASGAVINGLTAGTYSYTVTDASGCQQTAQVIIIEPVQLQQAVVITPVSCYGAATGAADLSISGGIPPYQITWSNALTSEDLSAQVAGTYTATIVDALGCQVLATATITQPDSISYTYTQTASTCSGSTGTLLFSATGGTAPYEYLLDNGSYQTSPFFSSLTAGLHTIIIRDANQCSISRTAIVASPASVGIQVTNLVDVSCYGGQDGSAQAVVSGGNAPFTFTWSSGESGVTASQLVSGANQVSVTDASGCSAFQSFSINQPAALTLSHTMSPVQCYGGNDGSLTLTLGGGSGSYSILWETAQTSSQITGLPVGFYNVDVTDGNGCLISDTLEVTQPSQPILLQTIVTPGDCGGTGGTITVLASGGTQPLSYLWNTSPAITSSIAGNLAPGSYSVVVTDANGCQQTASATLQQNPPLTATVDSIHAVSCNGLDDGQVFLSIQGGTTPYSYQWGIGTQPSLPSNLAGGTYTLTVIDSNGCSGQVNFNIPQPALLTANITPQHVTCFGGTNGRALLSVSGGTQPYSYNWSNNVQTSANNNIPAGYYTCTITDANGCVVEVNTTINQPTELTANLVVQQPGCNGNNNGNIIAQGQGGTGLYTYQWSTGSISPELSGLAPGLYTVNVIDENGCSIQLSQDLQSQEAFVISVVGDTLICAGEQVLIEASANGIHNMYSYVWEHGVTGELFGANPLETTTYTVTVQDTAGCVAQDSITIHVNQTPEVAIIADDTSGCAPFCAKLRVESTTATIFNWTLSDGSFYTGEHIEPCFDEPGVFSVNLAVKDDAGCSATLNWGEFIQVHPAPQANFTPFPTETNIEHPTVQFFDQSQGATNYTYFFGDPAQSSVMLNNTAFTYSDTGSFEVRLQVQNEFGCTDDALQTIHIGGFTAFYIPKAFTPGNSDGLNDVFLPKSTGMAPTGFEMSIYDRWGHLVFYSDSWEKGWDGTIDGKPVPMDTYVCKIRYYDKLGNGNDHIGAVTVTD